MASGRYDLFISYAHVDDMPLPGVEKGWVETLFLSLKIKLEQKIGRPEAFQMWQDRRNLKGNDDFNETILGAIRESATFLVILSQGHLESTYCQKERAAILEAIRALDGSLKRVFVVQRDEAARNRMPPEFAGSSGYVFWEKSGGVAHTLGDPVPRPLEDKTYYAAIDALSTDLAEKIVGLRPKPKTTPPVPDVRPVVYLAEVTDDLIKQHRAVKQFLMQERERLRVLPETVYPVDPAEFRAAARKDIAVAKVFVQLLGEAPGRRSFDFPRGINGLMDELAVECKAPVLRWRTEVNMQDVEDKDHLSLLESALAEPIEEFKARVVREATAPPPRPPQAQRTAPNRRWTVFVNAKKDDQELAQWLAEALDGRNIDCNLPMWDYPPTATPEEVLEDLEKNLLTCDTMICVYGAANATWVRCQLMESKRVRAKGGSYFPLVGVFYGPPPPKLELNLRWKSLKTIDGLAERNEKILSDFVTAVTSGGPL
jgi:hypothetical protein